MLDEKASDNIENANFGFEFENSIITKTYYKLKAKSINDKRIYTKNYRQFYALKIILINSYNNNKNYKNKLLEKGEYKILPFSNNYFKLFINNNDPIKVSYHDKEIYIINNKRKKIIKLKENEYSDDKYIGSIYFYKNGKETNLVISFYRESCEIDGLIEIVKPINLSDFKLDKIFSSTKDNFIQENSIMVYEIKSRNQKNKLAKEMLKKYYFIYNYLRLFYNNPIYYIGFYKKIEKQKNDSILMDTNNDVYFLSEINSNEINNKKEKDNNEIKEKEKNIVFDKKDEVKEKIIKDKKESNNSEINLNNTDNTKNEKNIEENKDKIEKIMKDNKIDKKETIQNNINYNNNKIGNEQEEIDEDTGISKPNLNDFDNDKLNIINIFKKLDNFPMNIILFRIKNSIFDEELKYDKEELNLLGYLLEDFSIIKNDIKNMNEKIEKLKVM